jgi:hypothetical protein
VDFGVASREDLERAPDAVTREGMTATLQSFLTSLDALQASAVLIIDEAQNLPLDVLEQLPLIAVAGEFARSLQVVLVGQPTLVTLMKRREVRALNRAVVMRAQLGPLAEDELAGYVMHRLGVAGAQRSRVDFSEAALKRIHALSSGVPRGVNLLCDRTLALGATATATVIDPLIVEMASADLDPAAGRGYRHAVRTLLTACALLGLMCVGASGALWVFRDAVSRTIVQWEQVPFAQDPPHEAPATLHAIPLPES